MRPLLPLLFLILLGISSSGPDSRAVLGPHPEMVMIPVPLDAADPARRTVDSLTYLGGVRLRSRDHAFGGFSAMQVRGDRFTLLSDGGNIVRFRMAPGQWRALDLQFSDLSAGPYTGWDKGSRDSELLTSDPAKGRIWVGFESANQIWRYDDSLRRAEAHDRPHEMRWWDVNGGPEAMVRLASGNFVVLSETSRMRDGESRAAVWFAGDPTDPRTKRFLFGFLPPADGYDPSDMAELPDGRLLVLTRRVSLNRWFETKLVLLDPARIAPGAIVKGQEIAALTRPLTRDNFEALAVTREKGATILWIASDDNLNLVQQTLLMKFRLDLPSTAQPQPSPLP